MAEKIKSELTCQRCGHQWFPQAEPPKVCPRCKSYAWKEAR